MSLFLSAEDIQDPRMIDSSMIGLGAYWKSVDNSLYEGRKPANAACFATLYSVLSAASARTDLITPTFDEQGGEVGFTTTAKWDEANFGFCIRGGSESSVSDRIEVVLNGNPAEEEILSRPGVLFGSDGTITVLDSASGVRELSESELQALEGLLSITIGRVEDLSPLN